MSAAGRSRGGRPAIVSKEKITMAALAVIDADGLENLSMRRVGERLGVEAMALYRHVPNKSAMLAAVVDHLTAGAAMEIPGGTAWTDALAGFGRRYREVLLLHPAAVPLLATHPVSPEVAEHLLGRILAAVELGGAVTLERVQLGFQSVAVFVLGHALAQVGTPPGGDAAQSASPAYYDEWFETGLAALCHGFAATLPT